MLFNISSTSQRLVFAVLVGAAMFCQGRAQSASPQSLIRGRVLDPNRAAIAGAQIIASPRNRSASSSALSNRTGEFSLALSPGEYTLTVTAEGFNAASQTLAIKPGASDQWKLFYRLPST